MSRFRFTGGPGDTGGLLNDDTQLWWALSTNGGASFTRNIQISVGPSNSPASGNGIDYGDYTGLSLYGGIGHPAWSDISNSTVTTPTARCTNWTSTPQQYPCRSTGGGRRPSRERRIQC